MAYTSKYKGEEIDDLLDKIVEGDFGGAEHSSITYSQLKALRDNGELTVGAFYRITDYECTTVQADSRSANHPFDIIVQALDERTLSENARAIQRDGDTYFANAKLEAWQLKYALDNDVSRFAWAKELIVEQPAKWSCGWGVLEERYDNEASTNDTTATIDGVQKYLYRPSQPTSYLEGKTFYRYEGQEMINLENASELYFVTRENPFINGVQTSQMLVIYAPTGRVIAELEVTSDYGESTDSDDNTVWNAYFGDALDMKTFGQTIDVNGDTYYNWVHYSDNSELDSWASINSPFVVSEGTKVVYNGPNNSLYYALDRVIGKDNTNVYEVTDGNHIYKYEDEIDGEDALVDIISYKAYIAPQEGGKGVIYRMIDEHNNDCPYDFKNLQFYNNSNWYYTFSQNGRDLSLTDYCIENYILPHTNQNFSDGTTPVKTIIPMVVFDMKSNTSGRFAGILHNKLQVPITKGYLAGTRIVANEWYDVVGGNYAIVSDMRIVSSGIIYGNRIYGPCSNFEVGTVSTPISAFYANNINLPNYQVGVFKCLCSVFNNNTVNLSEGKRGFTITSGSIISCKIENSNYASVSNSISSDDISLGATVVLRNSKIRIFNDLTIQYANTTSSTSPLRFLDIDARGLEATTITIPTSFPANASYELKVAKNSQGLIKMWCDADLIQ